MCVVDVDTLVCESSSCLSSYAGLQSIRRQVRELLSEEPADGVADAVLVVDELLTNALQHGQHPVRLRLERRTADNRLWLEIYDAAPNQPAFREPDSSGGRGLRLVEQLGVWGVVPNSSGKTVWIELPLVPT